MVYTNKNSDGGDSNYMKELKERVDSVLTSNTASNSVYRQKKKRLLFYSTKRSLCFFLYNTKGHRWTKRRKKKKTETIFAWGETKGLAPVWNIRNLHVTSLSWSWRSISDLGQIPEKQVRLKKNKKKKTKKPEKQKKVRNSFPSLL